VCGGGVAAMEALYAANRLIRAILYPALLDS
jgi:hypothetical protein